MNTERLKRLAKSGDPTARAELFHAKQRTALHPMRFETGTLPEYALEFAHEGKRLIAIVESIDFIAEDPVQELPDTPSDWRYGIVVDPEGCVELRIYFGNGYPMDEHNGICRKLWAGSGSVATVEPVVQWLKDSLGSLLEVERTFEIVWNGSNHVGRIDPAEDQEILDELWMQGEEIECPEYYDGWDWLATFDVEDVGIDYLTESPEAWVDHEISEARTEGTEGIWLDRDSLLACLEQKITDYIEEQEECTE